MTVFQYKLQKMADMTRSCSQTCKLYLKWVEHDSGRFHFRIVQHSNQTLANRGPDSRFVVEAIFKPLVPKLGQSSIIITQNRAHARHKSQPNSNLSEYQHGYTNTDLFKYLFQSKYKSGIVKADYGCVNSNTQIPDRYLMWYLTLNRPISKLFSNNHTWLSYLPKFDSYGSMYWNGPFKTQIWLA